MSVAGGFDPNQLLLEIVQFFGAAFQEIVLWRVLEPIRHASRTSDPAHRQLLEGYARRFVEEFYGRGSGEG
jgi:hypothetical protein